MAKKLSDHEKEKGCWFIAVSHDFETRTKMKTTCKEFPFWGWVDHQPDKETEESDKHFHTHIIIRTAGSRSIKQVSGILGCPSNYIQVCRNKRSQMRYFRHLDNPEKVQYGEEAIHASSLSTFKIAWQDNSDDDVRRLYSDLSKLRSGRIRPSDFVDLHYIEFQKMPFYQKLRSFGLITELAQGLPDVPAHGAPR